MKCVLMTRVSSAEQEERHSLAAQQARLLEYCKRKNLEIIKMFEIVESSTRGGRKLFRQMLDFCRNQAETVAIVADAVDRVLRGFSDSILLSDLIRENKIELHFYRESMIIGKNASATDILRFDFSVMAAKAYVLQLHFLYKVWDIASTISFREEIYQDICVKIEDYKLMEKLNTMRAKKMEQSYTAERRTTSLNVDEETRRLSEIASNNGYVSVVAKDVYGISIIDSTKEHPLVITRQYDEDDDVRQQLISIMKEKN